MKILFICTHNRCRSILAEAICNHVSNGKLSAKSAGSRPTGEVHPLSLTYLQEMSISTAGLFSQSWDEHESWNPDVVITVCDSAAAEECPVWFGDSLAVHWGLPDPSKLEGTEQEIAAAFYEVIEVLKERIEKLLEVNLGALESMEIKELFDQLGKECQPKFSS